METHKWHLTRTPETHIQQVWRIDALIMYIDSKVLIGDQVLLGLSRHCSDGFKSTEGKRQMLDTISAKCFQTEAVVL